MRRALWLPVFFSFAVLLILAAAATWTNLRLEQSLEEELGTRLQGVAGAAAAVIDPADIVALSVEGAEGLSYGQVLVDLEIVRRVSESANVFLLESDGRVLFDLLHPDAVGDTSALFAVERVAVTSAFAGESSVTRLYRTDDLLFKTGFAPVRALDQEIIAVVGVEADADFLGILQETRRNLLLTLAPAILAVFLLSLLFIRLSLARQRLEREFARAENLAAVGELAATLAHEVRNPLGVIKRSAERLKKKYTGEEPELLEYITEECDRLAGAVRRYLEFAKPAPQGERHGDLEEVVRTTAALLERECEERGITITVTTEGDGPWRVRMGAEELKQILLNLLRNGIEAFAEDIAEGPEGTQPAVGFRERKRRMEIGLERVRSMVHLSYRDNGPGMSSETLLRAREPFFTTRAKGSGLGLAIVDRLVREAGGEMRVRSKPTQGVQLDLWIPKGSEEQKGVKA